ncbi:MAG: 16S rRNA (adenine(1518)-N(6)/adenine(1519)-N(6))-dimethyltransferase [bacterium]
MTVFPKKRLGQHFLRDENIARKLIGYVNPDIPLILEIGPGMGILSKYLLEDPRLDPRFIEIDKESVAYLREHYPSIRERLIEEDFLRFDLTRLQEATRHRGTEAQRQKEPATSNKQPATSNQQQATSNQQQATSNQQQATSNLQPATSIQLIGNFPYNISSQILFRVFENRHLVTEVLGMFQKEVARRIASPPGSKEYGILSVLLQAFYSVEYLFTVNESVFTPPPKVKSAVIRLRRNTVDHLDCDENFWVRVVKTAFNQRRKTIRNSLRKLAGEPFTGWDDPLFGKRPEQLSVEEFVRLVKLLRDRSPENF